MSDPIVNLGWTVETAKAVALALRIANRRAFTPQEWVEIGLAGDDIDLRVALVGTGRESHPAVPEPVKVYRPRFGRDPGQGSRGGTGDLGASLPSVSPSPDLEEEETG